MLFGDYNIETGGEPIIIHYEAHAPMLPPGVDGVMAINCSLSHPDWGEGRATGAVLAPQPLEDGT
ncbi:MAG: hypothetical protein M3R02_29025, partial [Chloroflexota bacterium]|nr:hypothetical protein [Chloroflexota bacterium]